MIDVQRQKADALAAQIEQFVVATQSQISWSTAGVPAEQQRIEWLRLMRNAPAITELTHVGADGKESLFVSRLATDNVGRGHRLRERRALRPVYFRKPAEPDVSMAVARAGSGVTLAEVNVKKVWGDGRCDAGTRPRGGPSRGCSASGVTAPRPA
jgi:two-component system, NtrC family, sensor kinase